ncbi:MAG TPA: carboxypeptidase regulatory-like domain-containing protein [Tepidisphaeraceae bacterium]|nr:carboxypeptidase regulatory-like domain-containing protein [Tepidisphaeraceae bacterium]
MRLNAWIYAAALSAGMCTASFAQISGKVTLQGNPPDMPEIKALSSVPQCAALHKDPVYEDTVLVGDHGELQNVIVFIKPAEGQKLPNRKIEKPMVLDQKGCMYTPHVLAVEIGQPVDVKNSDPFLHNVHALSIDNPAFNFAQVNVSDKQIQPFTTVETFQIKCDVHPWMKAVIRVFDNPYFATTGEDGKYTIDTAGLPDGTYTVQAWHEVYHDSAPQQVEVKGGKASKPVDFTFQAKAGKAEAKPVNAAHLASAQKDCCKIEKLASAK